MQAYSWWNRIPYNDYMLQAWVLTTLLSLTFRFAFTIFQERYNRDSFKIALLLGFILGLVFILGGHSFISLVTGNVSFQVPIFYALSLLLSSAFLTWGSLDIAGNTILGSLLLATFIVAFSLSSTQAFNFTDISSFVLGPGFYIWVFSSLFISILFLVYFWLESG